MALKADLHVHTSDDPWDGVKYTSREIIDKAAAEGFDVLAITNHDLITHSEGLRAYAEERGILLIRGTEIRVEKKHVLLINVNGSVDGIRTLNDLRAYRIPEGLVIAPHPFYPNSSSLRSLLESYIDIFDAIEYNDFYFNRINFNRGAEKAAKMYGLPLVGSSDAHYLWQLGKTYTLIDADRTPESVVDAIKRHRVRLVTKPLKLNLSTLRLGLNYLL